jgi:uncharacterized protein (DUF1800 family)
MAIPWVLTDSAHLLRRAGFGGSYEEVVNLHAMGREAAIDWLVEYDDVPDTSARDVERLGLDLATPAGVIQAQLYRMTASTRPLQEKLTWFWHGHFVSALGAAPVALMPIQIDTWRAHASGRFRDFLYAMYKYPAMLLYLDNNTNVVGQPNENFAREVMELFTLGVGHYTETDVREAARALTGWTVPVQQRDQAVFVPRRHDDGIKTVLGVTGNLDADDAMDILEAQPACAAFVCAKLYRAFVGGEPSSTDLDALIAGWRQSGGDLREVMHVLLRLDTFWAAESRAARIKSPVEFGIGLYQRLRVTLNPETLRALAAGLVNMGQTVLAPPDVAGYPDGLEWAGTSSLLARYNAAFTLAYALSDASITQLLDGVDTATPARVLDGLLHKLGPVELGGASHAAVLNYLENGGYSPRKAAAVRSKARGALHLIAATPEYQLN